MTATWSPLHDVAFLYLYLAADTDGALDSTEIEAVLDLLNRRMPDRPFGSLRHVIEEALDALHGSERRNVRTVIENLKYSGLNDVQRRGLLNDLLHIARADGTVHQAEIGFIRSLARQWEIELPEDLEHTVRDLALVFLFMVLDGDDALEEAGRVLVTEQLAQWRPGLSRDALHHQIQDALAALHKGPQDVVLNEAALSLKTAFPLQPERRAILHAVMHLAQANGQLSAHELAFFLKLAAALDLA